MADIIESRINERRVTARFGHKDLIRFVEDAALAAARMKRSNRVKCKVTFEDETAGSPAYTVGTKVKVEIIEDMSPTAEAA